MEGVGYSMDNRKTVFLLSMVIVSLHLDIACVRTSAISFVVHTLKIARNEREERLNPTGKGK